MALDLITGHQGVAHISAEQISTINKAMMDGYGDNKVMRMKNGTLTQDGLIIEVATGYWRANGFDIEIQEAETVYIDPSSIGMSRIDNVYVELLQDIPTGAQRAEIVTIQGEEAASDPTAPDAPTSPYLNTDILLDVIPLASVTVTEGVMVLTDLTEDFDLVTPSELAAVEGEALAAQSAASTAQTAADNAQQAIAPIEASSTASQAYAIGEQFILNGLLTEATAAISQGDTIVVGNAGNAKLSDSVTDQLSTLKDALDDLTSEKFNVSVESDGVKTNRTLLNSLFELIDFSKITKNSKFVTYRTTVKIYYHIGLVTPSEIQFYASQFTSPGIFTRIITINSTTSGNTYINCPNINSPSFTAGNDTGTTPSAGLTYGIIY